MQRMTTMILVAALAIAGYDNLGITSGNEGDRPQEMPEDYMKNDALQKTRGEVHEKMAKRVGKWNIETQFSKRFGGMKMDGGTATFKSVCGGMFLMSEGKENMMGQEGTTIGVYGYDSLTKEFSVFRANSMYTAVYNMTGKMRPDGVVSYVGTMKDAKSPHGRLYRAEEIDHGNDKFEIIVYDELETQEFHVMTITYTRAKN